jgi:hypothetical protein
MIATILLQHPVLFVFDHANPATQFPEIGEGLVSATASCVAVVVVSEIDGPVVVTLGNSAAPARAERVFVGNLAVRSGEIAVVTSANEIVLQTEAPQPEAAVAIFVNDSVHPTHLWVVVESNRRSN